MAVIFTDRDKCKSCYACIRRCPVRAIRVTEGKAEVIKERCIACGTCVNVCTQKAKQVQNDTGAAWQLLTGYPSVIAILDASFPAAFSDIAPGKLVGALKKLGFSEVMEAAFGAELISREYSRLVREDTSKPILASHCPVIVAYVEKYYQLLDHLAPIVSPMIAMGRVIKWQYSPEAKVVFIGPCMAKKAEVQDEKVSGVVDVALTYTELKDMLAAKGIDPHLEEEHPFSGPRPSIGRIFPVSAGLISLVNLCDEMCNSDVIMVEGRGRISESVGGIASGEIRPKFVDIRLCQGCIGGPAMDNHLSVLRRREIIIEYATKEADPDQTERDLAQYATIDLTRHFTNRYTALPTPSEEELRQILAGTGKIKPEDELNCGACGYASCREMAAAIYQGLAETEMCWPYLIGELEATQADLIQAEKLTSLGQMAAAIAHEINNPLAGVLVYAKLLSRKLGGDAFSREEAQGYLSKMEEEIIHSSRIIRNLLDFSRQSKPMLRLVDINNVLEQALSLVGHQAELQNIRVIKELRPSLPKVMADFDQLLQVFTNLTLNAIQAMPEGGELTLRTTLATDGQPAEDKKGWIKIDIQDTGCGIPKENLARLFTPFFTTKEKGKGVGLGLAVAHGIIGRHQGRIEVQSEVGKGTTFSVYLGVHGEQEG